MKRAYVAFLLSCAVLSGVALSSCKTDIKEGDKAWNEMVSPFRKSVDVGGYSLHYIDMGAGDPVVMVHGFGDSTYCWHENASALIDAGFRVIMVDQPGFGRSDIPPEPYVYSIENQAKAVITLTERLNLNRFQLIGHSMGGGIALYIMQNYPRRIQKGIVIDPLCYKPNDLLFLTLPGMEFMANAFGGRWAVRLELEDAFFDSRMVDEALVDEYSRPLNRPEYYRVLVSLEKQYFSPAFTKMTQSHGEIQTPTLIIWGKNDSWIPFEFGKKLNGEVSNSTLMAIEKCGHSPHQECREKVNPILVDYLKRQD